MVLQAQRVLEAEAEAALRDQEPMDLQEMEVRV
jgi:hypothetical protein